MSITVYTTAPDEKSAETLAKEIVVAKFCLLYTSDAADE